MDEAKLSKLLGRTCYNRQLTTWLATMYKLHYKRPWRDVALSLLSRRDNKVGLFRETDGAVGLKNPKLSFNDRGHVEQL